MPGGDFIRYVDQLFRITYAKYDVVVNYFDLKFRYKNITGNAEETYTFKINAIVDFVETKEYTIYTSKASMRQADTWIVRVPEIMNNQIPVTQYLDQTNNGGTGPYNLSKIPWRQYIDGGLNYTFNTTDKLSGEGPVSRYIGIYQTASIVTGYYPNTLFQPQPIEFLQLQSDPGGIAYVSTNTAHDIAAFVRQNYNRYGMHPGLKLNFDPPPPVPGQPEAQEQQYFDIPIGVSKYKVILSNDQTDEKVITYINGTLWNNPVYSPVTTISSLLPPPGDVATLTLLTPFVGPSATVPDFTRLLPGDARNAIEGNGFVYFDAGYSSTSPGQNDIPGTVASHSPPPGSIVPVGATISVVFWPQ